MINCLSDIKEGQIFECIYEFETYKIREEYIVVRSPLRKVLGLIPNTNISDVIAFKELRKYYSYYVFPDQGFDYSTWDLLNSNFKLTEKFIKIPSIRLRADELTKEKFSDFFIQFKEDDNFKNIEVREIDLENKIIILGFVD